MKRLLLAAIAEWHDLKVWLATIHHAEQVRMVGDAEAELTRAEAWAVKSAADLRVLTMRARNARYDVERIERHLALGIAK